ncbi:unnamed protein product, partial [Closterium sp. NIES-53]
PPSGANIVDGMWIFRVKRPPGSPPVFKARYVARGFRQRQGVDFFQTFSSTPKMTTLRGSLHEEIWLRRPPGFTGSFPAGTQWSLRRPVYGLRQAPREWHDTLTTMLAALGLAPSTADPSIYAHGHFAPPFYVLVYVLQLFGFRYSSPQSTPLPTGHSLSAPPSDESVEPSGLCAELVDCLIHRPEHWEAAKRVLRYLCSTSGMGLVLGGRGPIVLTGHADASWVDDLATQRSCEAEIYVGAIAAQELRWLTYLLTDLGERPCSFPVLCVDNKAMIALCQEHRLEYRTKHIALRYFLSRELQQRGQLRLAYVATRANTADIFTKALQSSDHQPLHVNWPCGDLLVLRMCGDFVIHPGIVLLFLTGLVTICSPPFCLWGILTPTSLTLQQRLNILIDAAHGFEYLHSFGIVHRDIKPANILLDGNMQIADFGLVRLGEGSTVSATRVMGTLGFVDPAYCKSQMVMTSTDVYSVDSFILQILLV